MSINGIGAANSMMYSYMNQMRSNSSAQSYSSSLENGSSAVKNQNAMPPPPPPPSSSNANEMMASEMGIRMSMQTQDTGFTADQLSEMAEDDSPMSELFSALAENFDTADTDGDGVIKRDEAMAYAEENDIAVPPPPPPPGSENIGQVDTGFTADQFAEMAEDDSPMSELFSALSENFDEADTNGDGVVTRDEAMVYAKNNDISFPEPGDAISVTA